MSISFDENEDQCLETSGKMFEREKLKKIRGIILFMDRRLIEKVWYFGVASMIIFNSIGHLGNEFGTLIFSLFYHKDSSQFLNWLTDTAILPNEKHIPIMIMISQYNGIL